MTSLICRVTLLLFIPAVLLKPQNTPGCDIDGKAFNIGRFVHNCQQCLCRRDGSWKCDTVCQYKTNTCDADERQVARTEEVLPNCFCEVKKCAKRDKGCLIKNTHYNTGEIFISADCKQSCLCMQKGFYQCRPLCPKDDESKCEPGEIKVEKHLPVYSSEICTCKRTKCEKINPGCDIEEKRYAVDEEFIDKICKNTCVCQETGFATCAPLCPSYSLSCPTDAKLVMLKRKVHGSDRCFCDVPHCAEIFN